MTKLFIYSFILVFVSGCSTLKTVFAKKEEPFSVENIVGADKGDALAKFDKLGKAVEESNNAKRPSPEEPIDENAPATKIPKIQSNIYGVKVGEELFKNSPEDEMVYIIYGKDEYHKRSCPELGKAKDGSTFPIPLSKAIKAYTPCPICNP